MDKEMLSKYKRIYNENNSRIIFANKYSPNEYTICYNVSAEEFFFLPLMSIEELKELKNLIDTCLKLC